MSEKNSSQKKYLKKQKQLRVWMSPEKFEAFKEAVKSKNDSIYNVINNFVDEYLKK